MIFSRYHAIEKQPIRLQESHSLLDAITCNVPIMRRAYVALTVLATVFYMAGHKIVKGEGVCQENLRDKWDIP